MNKPEIIKSILAEKAKKKPLLEAWREAIDKGGVVLVRKYIRAMAYADLRRLVRALDDYDLLRLARAMDNKDLLRLARLMENADLRRLVRALDDYDLLRLARAMGVKLDGKRPNPK